MSGRLSRNKGARFEREVAQVFKDAGYDAKRCFQTRGGAAEVPDVEVLDTSFPLDIECKHGKKPPVRRALDSIVEHCREGRLPVAIIREDRRDAYCVLPLTVFIKLYNEACKCQD